MANMEQIYALQEVIRKKTKALEKDPYGFREDFKVTEGKDLDKEDVANGVISKVSGFGVTMKFKEGKSLSEKNCTITNMMGFDSVTLKPADSTLLHSLFVWCGQLSPAQFKKACEGTDFKFGTLPKQLKEASPAFDLIIDEICKKNGIVLDKTKQFAQGAASLEQKMVSAKSKQMAAQLHDGNTL